MQKQKRDDILLDTGTNELGILEFIIDGNSFGINVAKLKSLMEYETVQLMPRASDFIEGIVQPRDEVFTVVDLAKYLGLAPSSDPQHDILMVAYFNKLNIAFHVHAVSRIYRISWEAIEKPSAAIYGGDDGVITGIAKIDDRIISIIDFEKIIYDISPQTGIQLSELDTLGERTRSNVPILVAEDSMLLRNMLLEALRKAEYTNVTITDNGEECWQRFVEYKTRPGSILDHCACLITDIEMPRMDGHHLTKRVKDDIDLRAVPIIIFSSLIDENMRRKGEEVGANAQISKPEIGQLVHLVDSFVMPKK